MIKKFLESFGFEFRGIAGKFEMNWSLPEQKLNNEISSLFAEKIRNLIEKISQNTHTFNLIFSIYFDLLYYIYYDSSLINFLTIYEIYSLISK